MHVLSDAQSAQEIVALRASPSNVQSRARLMFVMVEKNAEERLCVEQSRKLFSNIRGRGGASNACFHS